MFNFELQFPSKWTQSLFVLILIFLIFYLHIKHD